MSDKNLQGSLRTSSDELPIPDASTSTQEDWRELAQRVEAENDPSKMIALVQQLVAKIDEERRRKPFRPTSQTHERAANTAEAYRPVTVETGVGA